jgi:hypothetical protein
METSLKDLHHRELKLPLLEAMEETAAAAAVVESLQPLSPILLMEKRGAAAMAVEVAVELALALMIQLMPYRVDREGPAVEVAVAGSTNLA